MLSEADADLVGRDRAMPGLPVVLDPSEISARLATSFPSLPLTGIQVTYVRYKPHTSCVVGYTAFREGRPVDLYARTLPLGARVGTAGSPSPHTAPGPIATRTLFLSDVGVEVRLFPDDAKLKTLSRLGNRGSRIRLFRKLLPDHPHLWSGEVTTLRYKPERRHVALLSFGGIPRAVLKFYTKEAFGLAATNAKTFQPSGILAVPRRLGRSGRHNLLAFEWLEGDLLRDRLCRWREAIGSVEKSGAALALLHEQATPHLPIRSRQEEAEALMEMGSNVGDLSPRLSTKAVELSRRLAGLVRAQPQLTFPIHGDFYSKQILLTEDTAAIIDLDEAVRGDPASDLGNFIAHLELETIYGDLGPQKVEEMAGALLDGYGGVSRTGNFGAVGLYTAAGLFRLALNPFRDRRPGWIRDMEAILMRVEEILSDLRRGSYRGPFPTLPPITPRRRRRSIPVDDPLRAGEDPDMAFLSRALDPIHAQDRLRDLLTGARGRYEEAELRAIRVVRHKPGRRCLIEYDLVVELPEGSLEEVTLVGKARAKGLDRATYELQTNLWCNGFSQEDPDRIMVPEPFGVVPAYRMWLQRKVGGVPATEFILSPESTFLAQRIAEAAHKVHVKNIPARRSHSIQDELNILHERLNHLARDRPEWKERLGRILSICELIAGRIVETERCGIHRDFYADHVVVDGENLYLVDFDLYCQGDPSLDIGNFIGSVTERCLRVSGDPDAGAKFQRAMELRFLELAGENSRQNVDAYALLTLVRHVHINSLSPKRRPVVADLLDLCESRLKHSVRGMG